MIRLWRMLHSLYTRFMRWEFQQEALWIIALWFVIVAIRFIGPFNLADQDQERPVAYMMDILKNNEWICQRDTTGDVTSKPPLYTWLGAIFSLPFGSVNRLTLYLPCMLAVLASALLVLWRGGKHFGRQAGFWGAVALIAALPSVKMVALARTDPLFMFMVFSTGLMAFECWARQRTWSLFWLLAGLATLTKGPLGLVLGAMGLLAIVWERLDKRAPAGGGFRWDQHVEGLFAFVVLGAGWFWLAVRELGQPVIDKMLGAELSRHIAVGDQGELPYQNVFNPFLYFLGRFIPWSLATLLGAGLVIKQPAADDTARRFQRFCIMALFGGIILFSTAGHKRPDHLFPLYPFAAILAGIGLAWLQTHRIAFLRIVPATATVIMLCYSAVYYVWLEQKESKVILTNELRDFSKTIKEAGNPPLTYLRAKECNAPTYSLQYFLGDMRYEADTATVTRLLNGHTPVFVAVNFPKKGLPLLRDAITTPSRLHVLAQVDTTTEKGDSIAIVSNQPDFKKTDRVATTLWDLDITTYNSKVTYASRRHIITFEKDDSTTVARASVGNFTGRPRELELHIFGRKEKITLMPGETWSGMAR